MCPATSTRQSGTGKCLRHQFLIVLCVPLALHKCRVVTYFAVMEILRLISQTWMQVVCFHGYGYSVTGFLFVCLVVVFILHLFLFCVCVFVCLLLFGGRIITPCGVVILTICVQWNPSLRIHNGLDHSHTLKICFLICFQHSRYRRTDTCVEFQVKKTASETWPRLTEERIKLPWLKIDFDKFMVEGESEEEANNTQGVRLKRLKWRGRGGVRGAMHMIIGGN